MNEELLKELADQKVIMDWLAMHMQDLSLIDQLWISVKAIEFVNAIKPMYIRWCAEHGEIYTEDENG